MQNTELYLDLDAIKQAIKNETKLLESLGQDYFIHYNENNFEMYKVFNKIKYANLFKCSKILLNELHNEEKNFKIKKSENTAIAYVNTFANLGVLVNYIKLRSKNN